MKINNAVLKVVFLASAAGAVFAEDPKRIKLATVLPRGSSIHQALTEMGDKWRQTPGAPVGLTIFTDGTMGGEAETVKRMRIDQLQASLLSVAGLAQIDASVTALQYMPMVFRSLEEVDYVRDRLRPLLDKRLAEKGFVALFWGDAGWVRIFSTKPALHPAEFKKMKMFALSSDIGQIDLMKAVGFQPMPLEYTDTLTGLQTGMFDVVPTIPFYALAGQMFKSAPYMLELNYVPLTGALVMTRKAFDALPAAAQATLKQSASEASKKALIQSRREMDESVTAMQKRGLKVNKMTPDLEAEWRVLFEPIYPKLRGNLVPADVFDEVQRLLREYRK